MAAWRAKRLVERLDRIEGQGRPAGSDEERGHRDVQPIHEAGLQEAGDGDPPTLDENPPIPLVSKRLDDGSRIEAVGTGHRQQQDVVVGRRRGIAAGGAAHRQRPSGAIRKDVRAPVESIIGIEHHPDGVLAFDLPHGETRIVRRDGAGADDHRIDQGPQTMEPPDVGRAGDVVGVAAGRGDPAVKALSGLRDDQVGPELERQIQLQDITGFVGHRRRRFPPA